MYKNREITGNRLQVTNCELNRMSARRRREAFVVPSHMLVACFLQSSGRLANPQLKKPPPQVHQVHSLSGFISLEYELVDFASSSKFIKFIPIPKAEIPRLRSGFRQQGSHPSNRNTGVSLGTPRAPALLTPAERLKFIKFTFQQLTSAGTMKSRLFTCQRTHPIAA